MNHGRIGGLVLTCIGLLACSGGVTLRSNVDRPPPVEHEPPEPADPEPVEVKLPELPARASCRQARAAYVESWELASDAMDPDLSRGQFGMILTRDHYFDHCGVPARYEVSICAAVQHGRVLGATVATKPRAPWLERCIDRGVRELSFPEHRRMDVTETVFRR